MPPASPRSHQLLLIKAQIYANLFPCNILQRLKSRSRNPQPARSRPSTTAVSAPPAPHGSKTAAASWSAVPAAFFLVARISTRRQATRRPPRDQRHHCASPPHPMQQEQLGRDHEPDNNRTTRLSGIVYFWDCRRAAVQRSPGTDTSSVGSSRPDSTHRCALHTDDQE